MPILHRRDRDAPGQRTLALAVGGCDCLWWRSAFRQMGADGAGHEERPLPGLLLSG